MRPVLRKYEIPYLCGTTLNKEFQIPVSDLLVGIEANKVIIRSKRLNKEVIPRMTTAHNFSMTTLPVYQFLCDLQYQQIRSIGWHWGVLDNRPFLPRVSYGKYILSTARWALTKDEVKDFDQKNDEKFVQQFEELKKIKNLPEYILLSQGDNELLLHLKNIFCLKLLLAEINKSGAVTLTESLDTAKSCWIKGPDGHHAGEFIFTFSKKKKELINNSVMLSEPETGKNIQRFFPVGSEWLYAKIYCGTKTAEKILSDIIKPFTEELLSQKMIDKFFFLRYHDAGQHIRIRFHKAGRADFWKKIINQLQKLLQPYMSSQLVYNVQFETYQREIERYGFDTMHLSEEIFFHQSVAVLNFISMLDGDDGEQYRWQIALKAIDLFLDGFHYTIEQRRDLIKMLDKSFAGEFNIKTAEQKKISERFSTHKQMVQLVMSDAWKENVRKDSFGEDLKRAIPVFQIDNDSYIKCVEDIINSPSVHQDMQQLNRLMPGYLHMLINRIFVSNQRKTELVIYDYLFRYYESKMVREKKANNFPEPLNVAG
jgi:thiopeptide-type bacteriocin biosynthesis protein